MLHAWFGNMACVLLPGRSFSIWGGFANLGNYPPVLKTHELYFSQGIVWDKAFPVVPRDAIAATRIRACHPAGPKCGRQVDYDRFRRQKQPTAASTPPTTAPPASPATGGFTGLR
jgi:hypothetical protein